jgi:endonuclease III
MKSTTLLGALLILGLTSCVGNLTTESKKVSSERKITRALNEVRKRIREIEQVIEYSNRLKTENTIKKESFWTAKTEQLNALSERLNDLSNKIRNLSQ